MDKEPSKNGENWAGMSWRSSYMRGPNIFVFLLKKYRIYFIYLTFKIWFSQFFRNKWIKEEE